MIFFQEWEALMDSDYLTEWNPGRNVSYTKYSFDILTTSAECSGHLTLKMISIQVVKLLVNNSGPP